MENNFVMRKNQSVFHHLIKLTLSKFAKNTSWTKGIVTLDHIEHVHHFHTVNSMGHPQKYSTAVGGHFHEVTWQVDKKTGKPVAKCGPALKKVQRNTPRGTKTSFEPLKWHDDENGRWIVDEHLHECLYLGTDELSAAYIQEIQTQNAKAIKAVESAMPKPTAEADIVDNDR